MLWTLVRHWALVHLQVNLGVVGLEWRREPKRGVASQQNGTNRKQISCLRKACECAVVRRSLVKRDALLVTVKLSLLLLLLFFFLFGWNGRCFEILAGLWGKGEKGLLPQPNQRTLPECPVSKCSRLVCRSTSTHPTAHVLKARLWMLRLTMVCACTLLAWNYMKGACDVVRTTLQTQYIRRPDDNSREERGSPRKMLAQAGNGPTGETSHVFTSLHV